MTHQLPNGCYTVCDSTEQCKELFELAKSLGYNCRWSITNKIKVISTSNDKVIFHNNKNMCLEYKYKFIPLPEFISRLKGEWVEPVTIEQLKEKYPLAVDTLKADKYYYEQQSQMILGEENGIVCKVMGICCWGWIQKLDNPEARQDEIGKMLADILNLIAKP